MAVRRSGVVPLLSITLLAVALLVVVLVRGWTPQLGLDLQGGASVVYESGTEVEDLDTALDDAIEIIRSRIDALGVAEPEIVRQGDAIVVNLPGVEDQNRALEVIGRTAELRFRPVLGVCDLRDIQSCAAAFSALPVPPADPSLPTSTTLPADGASTTATTEATSPSSTATTATTDDATTTSEGALGLSEGENAGVLLPVQESSTTSTTAAVDPSSTTATSAGDGSSTTATTAAGDGSTTSTTAPAIDDACELLGGATAEDDDVVESTVVLPDKSAADGAVVTCYVLGPVPSAGDQSLVGAAVSDPEASINTGQWGVNLGIKGEFRDLFNQVAQQCYSGTAECPAQGVGDDGLQHGRLAIVLDGQVQSAPLFNIAAVDDTGMTISGSFGEQDARDLALVLRFGALPIELERVNFETVSPTLGEDSLRAGLAAGLLGVGLVALYMLLYYRALGVVVILGLGVWSALLYAIVCYLSEEQGLALSLAGVTGLVVSVGVTVDSYVVFFERLKDEVRSGKTVRSSVDRGFKRAFRTILAANATSFIGAFLLYILTVGAVRGFAFMLGLSTILDVVVAYFFARPLVGLLGRSDFVTRSRHFGVARDPRRPAPAAVGSK